MSSSRLSHGFARTPLAVAFSILFSTTATLPVLAQSTDTRDTLEIVLAQRVSPVVVSANRSERLEEEVPAQVRVIEAEEIEKRQMQSIKDLVADEPGITVRRAPARYSAAGSALGRDRDAGFNIRGIEGNRVLIQVDGLRVPNTYSFGATNMGRGDYIDLATIARVELLRGPASALYGSDGLAGAVSFYTRTPQELLRRTRGDVYAALSLGYDDEERSTQGTATAAMRHGPFSMLAIGSHRRGHEAKNFGTLAVDGANRTAPNPSDTQNSAGLISLHYSITPARKLAFIAEATRADIDVDLRSGIGPTVGGLRITQSLGFDSVERQRGLLRYEHAEALGPWLDSFKLGLYSQSGRNQQATYEFRSNNTVRLRDQRYQERFHGLSFDAEKAFGAGAVNHRVLYGFDLHNAEYVALTLGNFPPAGESFPLKRFPDTAYRTFGAFVQDEMALDQGRLTLIPALRYDRYELRPERSPVYQGQAPAPSQGDRVSPKFGLVWKPLRGLSLYANFASGYRAPQPSQVNQGFENLTSPAPYRTIAAPDLRPETNRTFEIGLRHQLESLSYELAVFSGRYRDFIEQVQIGGHFTRPSPAVFQFVNLSGVKIRGAEASLRWRLAKDWGLRSALAWTEGDELSGSSRRPLNSIMPPRAILALEWRPESGLYGASLRALHATQKKAKHVSDTLTPPARQFLPPAYTRLDLDAFWQFHPQGRIVLAGRNLTDKKHWEWTNVRGVSQTSAVLDAFTESRRSFAATLRWEFR